MALAIYTATNPGAALSQDGAFTNPVRIPVDGLKGTIFYKQLYVRNDSSSFYYTLITVVPIDTVGGSIVDGTNGYSWKLKAGSTQPTESDWEAITAGASISLVDIGGAGSPDTSTYLPFWLRVEVPKNVDVATFSDVQLKVDTDQLAI